MDKIITGIIRKTHGIRGFLKVSSTSGETEHLFRLKKVTVRLDDREKEYAVEEVKPLGAGEVLMKFKGLDTPEEARLLSTGQILAGRDQAAPLRKGEVYQADLLDCRVFSGGREVGRVTDIFQGAQSDLLEVKTGTGTFLVPYMENYIGTVDVQAKTIELLAEWLLQ